MGRLGRQHGGNATTMTVFETPADGFFGLKQRTCAAKGGRLVTLHTGKCRFLGDMSMLGHRKTCPCQIRCRELPLGIKNDWRQGKIPTSHSTDEHHGCLATCMDAYIRLN